MEIQKTGNNYLKFAIEREYERQNSEICLIASENIVSKAILECQGSILTNKYAEGYPEQRYYRGCEVVDSIESQAINSAKAVFHCNFANVQPHSGSQANQAVYFALMKPGDTLLGMDLNAGGHLTHGAKVSSSGKIYNSITYGLDENGIINYKEIEEKLYKYNPTVLMVGASAYSRVIDYKKIKEIIDKYNNTNQSITIYNQEQNLEVRSEIPPKSSLFRKCYFVVDMAHIAGLVAAGVIPSPIPYADVVTSTTHKTLRGPRGGLILTNNEELAKKIDKAVFPGLQGGPLMHVIAGKAQCFLEAQELQYIDYQKQVLKNAKVFEKVFKENGIEMVSGGTDNHLLLLNLTKHDRTGAEIERILEDLNIVVNRNAIPNDLQPKSITSGIRIGTPNITTRGFKENDCETLARIISIVIKTKNIEPDIFEILKQATFGLASQHPIYK